MPIDYVALKSELLNDPAGLGYSVPIAAEDDPAVADMINLIRSGTAADGKSYSLFRKDIQPKEIVNCIASADFAGSTQLQIAKLNLLFVSNPIDASLTNVRANFQGIFSNASAGTIAALAAVAVRNGSRAEVLFGYGVNITSSDIATALRHTP